MAETKNDLQRLLYEFYIAAKQYNMYISTEKTKTIVILRADQVRQVKEKSIEHNIPAYLYLIDLKKAFDNVQIEDVIYLLYNRNIPLYLIKIIENIYKDNKVVARLAEGKNQQSTMNLESGRETL